MNLDEIKRDVNLIDYAKTHWDLKLDSRGRGSCPFHPPDNHNSFSIWKEDKELWRFKCFHGDTTGTIVDLKAKLENKSEEESIKELLEEFGDRKSETKEKDRGKKSLYVYRDRHGKEVYRKVKLKYKDGSKSFWFEIKDKTGWRKPKVGEQYKKIPYNLDKFKEHKSVIICEGEKDSDTVNQLSLGLLATSAPTGKSNWPDSSTKYFEQFKQAFFFYDVGNETDAKKHAAKLQIASPDMEIYIAKVPLKEREADITDYLERQDDKQMAFLDIQKHAVRFELRKEQEEKLGPILISLDSIDPEPVQWLWHNRFPLGKLSLIVGDPGVGKSFLLIYLAAHITTGQSWPDIGMPITKGSVIILTAEDGLADTIRIRADAAGADVKKIKILEGVRNEKGNRQYFNLTEDIPALEQAINNTKDIRLICIDPLTAYLGKINSHKSSEVRGILAPLAGLTEKYKVAIVAITHLNKNTALQAIYRTMGSLSFVAAARAAWAVTTDENDISKKRRLLIPLKTNLSIDPTSLAFRIIDNRIVFEESPIEVDVEEALSKEKHEETSALNDAVSWLREALEDGPMPSTVIHHMANENHISNATLRRAKEKLRVKPYKEGMAERGKWIWKL
jgi:RecA-family ATPase